MAGGTWTAQNKVRPGVYINIVSAPAALGRAGNRGTAAVALTLGWGAPRTLLTLEAGEDPTTTLGYPLTAPELLLVREGLKRASKLLVYRLNDGVKASAAIGSLTATAKYSGVRGNDISVIVASSVDVPGSFEVSTLLSGVAMNKQIVLNIAGLVSNDWVVWSGTGTLTASAGTPLAGGTNGTTTNADHTSFMSALELADFNTAAYPGTDATLKGVYAAFARRLREDEGKKVQVVLENYPTANHEGVISVKNGVVLADGTALTAAQATVWVAAATAAAEVTESLTYDAYDDAVDVSPRYTNTQIIAALQAGEFVFTPGPGVARIEQDINTLTGFTPEKGRTFAKNRVIRVLDGFANDIKATFDAFYLGKVGNNADGRSLLKGEIIAQVSAQQGAGAIQNFDPQTDVTVTAGAESDSVYVELNVQPVDSVEKIYMKVTVN